MKWRETSKHLPPEGDELLCVWVIEEDYKRKAMFGVAKYERGNWHDPEDENNDFRIPDYWMPLPPSPLAGAR